MIDRHEIEKKSEEFEIHPSNVERDYVFGWLIYGLFTVSTLRNVIFLKGGNALRKGYISNTRFSRDLDFGIPGDISSVHLLAEINNVCVFIENQTGVCFVKENNKVEEKFTATTAPIPDLKVYEARIYFKDFYGNPEAIKIRVTMDLTRFDKVLLPIQSVNLIHPYSDAPQLLCSIRCMKLEEIVATKLKCLLQREHAPDLFDYVYSMKLLGNNLNRIEVVRAFVEKTIFRRNPHVAKSILLKTPFEFFKEYWNQSVICAQQILFTVDEAIRFFLTDLHALFQIFPETGYSRFAYFGPELRIPIMKAGRTQTRLRIRYKGSDRIVEPYSLKYLQTRSGEEREYLYVYNVSGGHNEPGIRQFVSENIQAIENTDDRFELRYPVELSKAGELPENPYLFDPRKPTPSPRRTRSRGIVRRHATIHTGPKYIYQCGFCGRRFSKRRQDSRLGKHKNKSGYPCSGRSGYYVTTRY